MFGRQSKAISTAVQAVAPYIRGLESIHGMPTGFWQHPYVLGFFYQSIWLFAKLPSGGKLAGEELGDVVVQTFKELLGVQHDLVVRDVLEYRDEKHPEFHLGVRNADKLFWTTYGNKSYDNDPDVVRARERASMMVPIVGVSASPAGGVAAELMRIVYYDAIKARFKTSDEKA